MDRVLYPVFSFVFIHQKFWSLLRKIKQYSWRVERHKLEQSNTFQYLRVGFHSNSTWNTCQNYVVQSTLRSMNAIKCFFYIGGRQLLPMASKLFEAKTLAQIVYEKWTGIYVEKKSHKKDSFRVSFRVLKENSCNHF